MIQSGQLKSVKIFDESQLKLTLAISPEIYFRVGWFGLIAENDAIGSGRFDIRFDLPQLIFHII